MNKISKYIINNKLTFACKILASSLFAETVFLDSRLTFRPDIYATIDIVNFYPINVKSILLAVLAFICVFALISGLELIQAHFSIKYIACARKAEKKDYLIWIISFILLICAWSPYFLSYFPGGMYPDTAQSFGQAINNTYNNQQPIFYALIIKICILLCGEIGAMSLFTILQILFMASCFSYILFRLRLHNVNIPALAVIFAYFALFNLVPLYVVSLWKDTLFSTALLMYIFLLTEHIILCKNKPSIADISSVIAFMVISIFLRNNGLYVMIATTFMLLITFRKRVFSNLRMFFTSTCIALIICFIVQGPIFNSLNMNGPFVENLGVIQQQISYSMLSNGEFSDDDYAFLCQIMPFNDLGNRDYYRPFNVDNTKWSPLYNSAFLEENKVQYLKIWGSSFIKNPRLFMNAYLYTTLGYWDPFKQLVISYVNPEVWEENSEDPRFAQSDYIHNLTGTSIRNSLIPKSLISSAAFLFVTLVLFVLCINKKNKSWLAFVPALTTYLTVFIATPLAFALRYVYILVLTLPIFILYVFIRVE